MFTVCRPFFVKRKREEMCEEKKREKLLTSGKK